jgi:hypothetical protein
MNSTQAVRSLVREILDAEGAVTTAGSRRNHLHLHLGSSSRSRRVGARAPTLRNAGARRAGMRVGKANEWSNSR